MDNSYQVLRQGKRNFHTTSCVMIACFIAVGLWIPVMASADPLLHNSANLGTKYGTWGTTYDCSTCHSPNTINIKVVKASIGTPTGNKPVAFDQITATGTTAAVMGNDLRTAYQNGSHNVCEVCHHKTVVHNYSSSKVGSDKNHKNANDKDCTKCHPHDAGFQAVCNTCHGYPPIATTLGGPNGLVNPATNALGTAPTDPGAHDKHVVTEGMNCDVCHYNNSSHDGSSILMGFAIKPSNWPGFVGTVPATPYSTYSGNNTAGAKPAASSDPSTIVRNTAITNNSCNVYCHGNWSGANGTINPRWAAATGQAICGTCHGASASRAPQTGTHTTHASNSTGNYGFSCTTCHPNASSGANVNYGHIDGSVQWRLSSSTSGLIQSTATYRSLNSGSTGSVAPSASFGTCANIYCHSTVQNATNGTNTSITYRTPTWGGTALNCGGCHVDMSTDATGTGDHLKHARTNAKYDCKVCHSGYTATTINTATHVNRTIEVNFTGNGAGTVYNQGSGPAQNGYSYCSTSKCHGQGFPIWGGGLYSATVTCENCHGSATTNPFYSTATGAAGAAPTKVTAATDAKVGAHTNHLTSSLNYSSDIACTECHLVPTLTNMTSHFRTGTATITFGTLAKSGSLSPTYSAGACNNLYCHGDSLPQFSTTQPSFVWNTTGYLGNASAVGNASTTRGTGDCAACHCYPPLNSNHLNKHTGGTATQASDCTTCHSHVNAQGTGFSDVTKHIDGLVEATGGHSVPYYGSTHDADAGTSPFSSCTGCHTNTKSTSYPFPQAVGVPPDCQNCHTKASPVGSVTNGCHSCHGTSGGGGRPAASAYPDRAGKHTSISQHNTTCTTCHDLSATSGYGTGYNRHGWANRKKTYLTYSSVKRKIGVYTVNAARTGSSTRNSGDGTCSGNVGACCTGHGSTSWY